jgi:beta-lactam-binding protein with PASTA domain
MVAALVSAGVSASVSGPAVAVVESPPVVSSPGVRAASAADALVAGRPEALRTGPDDAFLRLPVQSSLGWQYVPYERTYRGLPVLGGDFVVVVDPAGEVSSTSVAQQTALRGLDVEPAVTRAAAERVAVGRLADGVELESVLGSRLVVDATGTRPRLAWESEVAGRGTAGPSVLSVVVDAVAGTVVRAEDQQAHDVGHSGFNGGQVDVPSAPEVCERTCPGPERWILAYPAGGGMSCSVSKTKPGPAPLEWGNGDPTHHETACVDMMFAAGVENAMLADWLGRPGITGRGVNAGVPMAPDSDVVDGAYYQHDGIFNNPYIRVGRRPDGKWLATLDIVGHENGHGVDDHTPGDISHPSTKEFVADAFGLATEWYANRPAPYDTRDYVHSDTPILGRPESARRHFYNPSRNGRAANCYSDAVPAMEPHAAAGVGDHWLYLLAEGSNPSNGQPTSPTCNGSTVTGVGLRAAMQILYHAMLMKNSNSTYLSYRSWTLTAARNLFPHDCNVVSTVRRAWDAVSVPAQPGEPACAVPQLVGQSHQAAHNLIFASGLTLGAMTGQVSHAPIGTVLSQSPAPGSFVPVHTPVSFTYSLGAVQVPHVFDRSCADASNVIRSVGLVPSCTGAGPKVTAVSPMVGGWAPPGSVITLTLSTQRLVPDVTGETCAFASDMLRRADLVPHCNGTGAVVNRQNPGRGTTVTVGTVVQLSMGTAPRPRPECPGAGAINCP